MFSLRRRPNKGSFQQYISDIKMYKKSKFVVMNSLYRLKLKRTRARINQQRTQHISNVLYPSSIFLKQTFYLALHGADHV